MKHIIVTFWCDAVGPVEHRWSAAVEGWHARRLCPPLMTVHETRATAALTSSVYTPQCFAMPQSAFSCCPSCPKGETIQAHHVLWGISDTQYITTCWSCKLCTIMLKTRSSVCMCIIYKEQHLHIPIKLGASINDAYTLRWAAGSDADQIVASLAAEAQRRLMTQAPARTCCLAGCTYKPQRPILLTFEQMLSHQPHATLQIPTLKRRCRGRLYTLKYAFQFKICLKVI